MKDNKKQIEYCPYYSSKYLKHIEELAKHFEEIDPYTSEECENCGRWEHDVCPDKCFARKCAEYFINLGYQKVLKDSVVLSKTEKEKLFKEMYEQGKFDAIADLEKEGKVVLSTEELKDMVKARTKCVENAIIRTRKETAEKILKEFANIKVNGSSLEDYIVAVKVVDKIDEIAKQFGVEIKE